MMPVGSKPPFGGWPNNKWDSAKAGTLLTLTNNDLTAASTGEGTVIAVYGKSAGVFQVEHTIDAIGSGLSVGVAYQAVELNHETIFVENIWTLGYNGIKSNNATSTSFGGAATSFTTGDVVGVVFNFAGNVLNIYKNGALLINTTPDPDESNIMTGYATWSQTVYPALRTYTGGGAQQVTTNFGATPFRYPGSSPMYGPTT